jgi:hypothetical protein
MDFVMILTFYPGNNNESCERVCVEEEDRPEITGDSWL